MKNVLTRRSFIQRSLAAGIGIASIRDLAEALPIRKSEMKFGLVTYQWAKDWDLPTIIANCEKTGYNMPTRWRLISMPHKEPRLKNGLRTAVSHVSAMDQISNTTARIRLNSAIILSKQRNISSCAAISELPE